MTNSIPHTRREFLKTSTLVGGGLLLGFHLPFGCRGRGGNQTGNVAYHAPNAYVRIGTDETVSIVANHAEMGQGIYTSLCQLLADELEADWKNVRVEHAPLDEVFNHTAYGIQVTGSSSGAFSEWDRMRRMGAATKLMLVQAAANEWGVSEESLTVENGVVKNGSGTLTFGQLAEKAAQLAPPKLEDVQLKDTKDFKFIGKPVKRLDTPDKCNGRTIFGLDVSLPGQLVAMVVRPPAFGATVKSFDAQSAKSVPGVQHVVQIDRGVAVVADGFWTAKKGRDALKVEWDMGPHAQLSTESQGDKLAGLLEKEGNLAEALGDTGATFKVVAKTLEATYELPYLAHTPMEPLNCVADVKGNTCEIHIGTQSQTLEANALSKTLGIPMENIKINLQYLGGGFGRRTDFDCHVALEAAQISQKVGVPIKLIWSREDDVKGGYYRPRVLSRMKGGIDQNGQLVAIESKSVSASIMKGGPWEGALITKEGVDLTAMEGMIHLPYKIPNVTVRWMDAESEVPVLWWRSVGHSQNAFITETFIDELAEMAGKDEYEFRRELLQDDPRSLDALDLAVSKSPWGKKLQEGHVLGMAVHTSFGSAVAHIVEVSIEDKWPKIHKVWSAIDCGPYINPDSVKAQIEGSVVFGLTAALYGKITLKNGGTEQSNFHDYKMLRINETPYVEAHIVESDKQMGGVGEPGVPPIAPAVANALYKLTGKRIHKLPFDKKDFI